MSEEERTRHFAAVGNMPQAWSLSAEALLAAGRILRGQREAFDPFQLKVGDPVPDEGKIGPAERMLAGFAIECLLKGLWVKQGHRLAVNGRYVGVPGAADHDLVQLADAVGFRVKNEARDVLKRLSVYVISVGRYPIPKRATNPDNVWWLHPTHDRTLQSILDRLRQKMNAG